MASQLWALTPPQKAPVTPPVIQLEGQDCQPGPGVLRRNVTITGVLVLSRHSGTNSQASLIRGSGTHRLSAPHHGASEGTA